MKKAFVVTFTIMLALTASASAQSGRKQKKEDLPPVQGVPPPSKTEEPPKPDIPEEDEKTKAKKPELKYGIILGTFWGDMNSSMGTSDYVRSACRAEMMKLVRGLEVRDNNQMSRSDAIKIAKEEEKFYPVALEFESFAGRPEVRYTIFEPKTGKITGTGSVPIYPDPTGNYSYYSYQRAARDLARQILGRIDRV